ncbi:MAG: hypothetical protein ACTSQJ_08555 [Promethearchaeota archaeon]
MKKKLKYKIIVLTSFLFASIIFSSYAIINITAAKDEDFDPKLQLADYLSFDARIVDAKLGYLDDDSDLDMVIAYESKLTIYEDEGKGFKKIWDINVGDNNFIDEDSNITAIEIGQLIKRSTLGENFEVSSVSNSTNCNIIAPVPDNLTYFSKIDNNYYDLIYAANRKSNFTVELNLNYGIEITSFTLKITIRDDLNAPLPGTNASLKVWNDNNKIWEDWYDLKNNVGPTFSTISLSSSTLTNSLDDYLSSNKRFKISFSYNHSNIVDADIDMIDFTVVETNSISDIIVGGGEGEICIIQCKTNDNSEYTPIKLIEGTSYAPSVLRKYRGIPDILAGDMDNDGTDEFVICNHRAKIYAFNHTTETNFQKMFLQNDDLNGIIWELKPASGLNPAIYNDIYSLSAIDPTSGDFILFIATKENFYTIKYDENSGFPTGSGGYPKEIELVDTKVNDLKICNLPGGTTYELVIGTLKGNVHAYKITGTSYGSEDNYKEIYDSGDLIAGGNEVVEIITGDFNKKNEEIIAIGTTLTLKKVQVLEKGSDYKRYWDSDIYMREDIIELEKIEESGKDTLVVFSETQVYCLSVDYDDSDGDKLSDLSERVFYTTDSELADSDSDGLEDGVEIFVYGTDPLNPDTDGDLIPDGWEIATGTDPLNPLSNIIIIILIPTVIAISSITVIVLVRKSIKQKKAEYEKVRKTPNLMPQIRRLIIQRLETFNKEFKGFKSKSEMAKFKRNLDTELMSIILDRLYNFLEYLRLKGIIFSDREENIMKKIMLETLKPIENKTDTLLKNLLNYETKYKQFKEQFTKLLAEYAEWKKPAKKGTKIIEELIKCPKCQTLGPKGSAFCLECGNKLV